MIRRCIHAFLAIAAYLAAQTNTGTVTGRVYDSAKSALPGATITITNLSTNTTEKVVASEQGNYSAPALLPGQYRLRVEKEGFTATIVEPVEVFTASVTTHDVTLQIGSVNESVTVRGDVTLLSQDSAAVSSTVENKLLTEMPFPERSALGAIMLAAGIQGDPQYAGGIQSENAGIYTPPLAPGGSIAMGGGRPGSGSILVDGSDISLASYPRTGVTFSGDTVKEMSIQVNGLPAQYGRTGGGIINQSTKGGSNGFHGGGNWQHTDPGLEAWTHGTHQAGVPPQRHQNLFGAYAGGPVLIPHVYNGRDRTFFYMSVEPARLSDLVYTGLGRIPTPAELRGDLSYGWDVLNRCCNATLKAQGAEAAMAQVKQLYAAGQAPQLTYQYALNSNGFPIGDRFTNSNQYVPIPGNNLSAQLAKNPLAQKILSYYPSLEHPNPYAVFIRPDGLWDGNGNNAFLGRGVQNTDNRSSYRLDHTINSNSRLAFRYTFVPVNGQRFNFLGLDSPANANFLDKSGARNLFLSHTQLLGGNKVNEFRLTYMRANQIRYASDIASSQDYGAALGLRPATQGFGFPAFSGLPGATLGSGGTSGNGNGTTLDVNFGVADDFSYVRGKHALKFGGDFRAYQMNRYDHSDLGGGTYNFNASQTNDGIGGGSALGSFILGVVNSYTVRTALVPFYYRWKYVAGYLQDDWKVRSNLTFNIGVRYGVETPRTEKYNRQGTFDPNVTGTLNGVPVTGGFVFSGENGHPAGLWNTNWRGIEPRAGFAWTPLRFMTARGSYGLMRAPLTGQSFFIVPDLNVQQTPISGNSGGVNPGQVNLVTNPVGPIPPNLPLTGGPLFGWTGGGTSALPYIDPSSAVPYTQQWSFSLQFAVSQTSVFEFSYVGNKGTHLFSPSLAQNAVDYGLIKQKVAQQVNFNATVPNPYGVLDSTGRLITMNVYDRLRPFPQLWTQDIPSVFDRRGSLSYHALYVSFKQRLSRGLNLQGSYAFSKSIDDASASFGGLITQETDIFGLSKPQNPNNLHAERSESTYSIPHKISFGYTYELPFGKGRMILMRNRFLNGLFGGWNTAGIYTLQSGYPIWLRQGSGGYWFSLAGSAGNLANGATLRPDLVPGVPLINPDWRKNPYGTGAFINPAALAVPGSINAPEFGDMPRTVSWARNPATQFFDANISKRFNLTAGERVYMTLRADFLNALNHPDFFFNPNTGHDWLGGDFNRTSLTSPSTQAFTLNNSFGQLSANNALPGRTIRMTLRLNF